MTSRNNNRTATNHIDEKLRDALALGRPVSYRELASAAGCDERTVRNYLNDANWAQDLPRCRSRGDDGRIRVQCKLAEQSLSIEMVALDLAKDILRRFFPIAGTSLDRKRKNPLGNVAAFTMRGAFEYGEDHLAVVQKWLAAVGEPRRLFSVHYRSLNSEPGIRQVWPIGILIREVSTVYLVGLPADKTNREGLRVYNLERVDNPCKLLSVLESGSEPDVLKSLSVSDAGDLPFSIFRATIGEAVTAKLRFSASVADQIWGRRWHARQKMRRMRDGRIELSFGPVLAEEVIAWLREWEGEVEVVGDMKLRDHYRGSEEVRT